jgi:hypothetical protein
MADDDSEREVASFTLGKGQADWGPLTVYAVMKSGDIYSICPYMPQNAYVCSLTHFAHLTLYQFHTIIIHSLFGVLHLSQARVSLTGILILI